MNWIQLARHLLGAVAAGLGVTLGPEVSAVAADPGVAAGVAVAAYAITEKLLKNVSGESKAKP